jgi:hypothetical protein
MKFLNQLNEVRRIDVDLPLFALAIFLEVAEAGEMKQSENKGIQRRGNSWLWM